MFSLANGMMKTVLKVRIRYNEQTLCCSSGIARSQ